MSAAGMSASDDSVEIVDEFRRLEGLRELDDGRACDTQVNALARPKDRVHVGMILRAACDGFQSSIHATVAASASAMGPSNSVVGTVRMA